MQSTRVGVAEWAAEVGPESAAEHVGVLSLTEGVVPAVVNCCGWNQDWCDKARLHVTGLLCVHVDRTPRLVVQASWQCELTPRARDYSGGYLLHCLSHAVTAAMAAQQAL